MRPPTSTETIRSRAASGSSRSAGAVVSSSSDDAGVASSLARCDAREDELGEGQDRQRPTVCADGDGDEEERQEQRRDRQDRGDRRLSWIEEPESDRLLHRGTDDAAEPERQEERDDMSRRWSRS